MRNRNKPRYPGRAVKLPKQLPHWAMLAGLKPEAPGHSSKRAVYWRGHGRRWRMDDKERLCMSCPINGFDRWANSTHNTRYLPILTEREFLTTVTYLLSNGTSLVFPSDLVFS